MQGGRTLGGDSHGVTIANRDERVIPSEEEVMWEKAPESMIHGLEGRMDIWFRAATKPAWSQEGGGDT